MYGLNSGPLTILISFVKVDAKESGVGAFPSPNNILLHPEYFSPSLARAWVSRAVLLISPSLSGSRSWFTVYSLSWPLGPTCYWFWQCPGRIVPRYSLWLTSLYRFRDECLMIFCSLQLTAFLISTLAHGFVSHSIPIFEAAIRTSISHKIWMVIFSYFTSYAVRQWVA